MKVLVLLSRIPYPLEKGDKLRAYHQIKQLSQKHAITLFAITDLPVNQEHIKELEKFCKVHVVHLSKLRILLNLLRTLFTSKPFQVGYFYFKKAEKELHKIIKETGPDHIYCQLIRMAEYTLPYPETPKTLDYMDVFSKGMERCDNSSSAYLKPIFRTEHKRLLKYEHDIFDHFDNKTIISEQDRNSIPHKDRDQIVIIPNGVDTDFFKPIERKKEFDLLFNGNMQYPPNIESAEYLVNKVLPLVQKKMPEVRVLISGATPAPRVLALASKSVTVSGWVDDIRENFAKSRILVAPMQIGTGLQNKLLEAMAMQVPCITSKLANNALGAENNKEILIAGTPEEYAEKVIRLLQNEAEAHAIALSAYQFVLEKFNWKSTTAQLEALFNKTPLR